jgi:hypothetical protein
MAKMRSPNYPAIGLGNAIEMAGRLWEKEKKTAVNAATAAIAIGYKGLSGPSRTALAAMKKFGLLEEDKSGYRVSPLALRIIHPASDDERLRAMREAGSKPELFRQLLKTHAQASTDALRSYLITRLDFSETGAKALIDAFKDTISIAKLDDPEYSVPDGSEDGQSMDNGLQVGKGEVRSAIGTKALRTFSWPLSSETTARLEIVGNEELTSEHIDALNQYLEVAKKLLKLPKN